MRIAFILLFTSFFLNVFSQGYTVEDRKAIKYFEVAQGSFNARDYEAALGALRTSLEREPEFIEAYLLQFESLIELKRYDEAEQSLVKALTIDPDFFPNGHFFYADLKLIGGDYKTAKVAFEKFLTYTRTNPNLQDEASRKLANCDFAIDAMANPVSFDPVNLGSEVNSHWSEYFPSLTTDDKSLIYTRRHRKKEDRGEQEDFYRAQNEEGWNKAQPMRDINTPRNEGAPSISPDGSLLFFTACADATGSYGERRKGYGSCDLFYSSRQGTHWSPAANLGKAINSIHWETQPSFSSDGRTLYFVRGIKTRSGKVKKQDIYVSRLDDFGAWSVAEKLPPHINTPFRESSVLIHPDGQTLYFTSEGHPGMGGEDIYLSRLQADGTWGTPVNLGYPINTSGDENSITVSANGKLAYFASDREGGLGGMDIYQFELDEGFRPKRVSYMEGEVVDKETKKPLAAKFELIDLESEQIIVESYADPVNGGFLVSLPEGHDYALNVEMKGYLFFSENFNLAETSRDEPYKRRIELTPIREGESVVLKNVFYETGSYELSPKSKAELNKLVHFLNKNYKLSIELGGHTDNVGGENPNQVLSENRAKAVMNYLVEEGIPSDRLSFKGYGASKPISSNETEEGRAQNRRTEFKVISSTK